jgi:ubiquinone/menaquinone biosynthesis C-methylase UbiE
MNNKKISPILRNVGNENYQFISYAAHSKTYNEDIIEKDFLIYNDWLYNGTVDVWRHIRMFQNIDPLLKIYENYKWLSVADGKWGTATRYIISKGGDALATDIDTRLLEIAVEKGLLKECKKENAEKLSFKDNSFDFSYCKEAFHHFPRAYIGIYEMLRVSKIAVVITEPRDWLPVPFARKIMQFFKNLIKKFLRIKVKHSDTGNYEPIGNYVFTVSEREIEKIALGLHLPHIAFKTFQDVYIEGVEKEMIVSEGPIFKKIQRKLFINRILNFLTIEKTNHITAIIFKIEIPKELRKLLNDSGYEIIDLPSNPYKK